MPREKTRTFGAELKRLRMASGMGLRVFANLIDMAPSNLSNIERGKIPPPAGKKMLDTICDALGLPPDDPNRVLVFDLAAAGRRIPADVAEAVKKQPGVPVLVRTVADKQLSEKKIRELAEYIKKYY